MENFFNEFDTKSSTSIFADFSLYYENLRIYELLLMIELIFNQIFMAKKCNFVIVKKNKHEYTVDYYRLTFRYFTCP